MTAEEDKVKAAAGAVAKDNGNDEEEAKLRKRKERLEQNRVSARESRKRKKTMIEELQRTVITLSRENKELNDRNETLRRQLMEIGAKYPDLVPLQAIMQGASAAGQQAAPGEAQAAHATAAAAEAEEGAGVPTNAAGATAAAAPGMMATMAAFPQMGFWPQQGQQQGAPAAAAPAAVQPTPASQATNQTNV